MEFYESFMKFSFADEDVFCIENDSLVQNSDHIKACECVVLLHPHVALIEAKASSPREVAGSAFIEDIKQKFVDSLRLFNEIKNKEHGEEAYLRLPVNLRSLTLNADDYLICLIVHGHKLEWLIGLQDAFREALREVIEQWNIKDYKVKVYNEEMALEKRLIVAYVPKEQRDILREPNGNISQEKMKEWFDCEK